MGFGGAHCSESCAIEPTWSGEMALRLSAPGCRALPRTRHTARAAPWSRGACCYRGHMWPGLWVRCRRKMGLGPGDCRFHRGAASLVLGAAGAGGVLAEPGLWPPGTLGGLWLLGATTWLGGGQERGASSVLRLPGPREPCGARAGRCHRGSHVDSLGRAPARCWRQGRAVSLTGPSRVLSLPDERRSRQHLELAVLYPPHHHRLLLHAQPGPGRAVGVRAAGHVCRPPVPRPGRGAASAAV